MNILKNTTVNIAHELGDSLAYVSGLKHYRGAWKHLTTSHERGAAEPYSSRLPNGTWVTSMVNPEEYIPVAERLRRAGSEAGKGFAKNAAAMTGVGILSGLGAISEFSHTKLGILDEPKADSIRGALELAYATTASFCRVLWNTITVAGSVLSPLASLGMKAGSGLKDTIAAHPYAFLAETLAIPIATKLAWSAWGDLRAQERPVLSQDPNPFHDYPLTDDGGRIIPDKNGFPIMVGTGHYRISLLRGHTMRQIGKATIKGMLALTAIASPILCSLAYHNKG